MRWIGNTTLCGLWFLFLAVANPYVALAKIEGARVTVLGIT